ncbi:MAG: hypothetical protein WDO74_30675 [Pseudomonadota bacterium]
MGNRTALAAVIISGLFMIGGGLGCTVKSSANAAASTGGNGDSNSNGGSDTGKGGGKSNGNAKGGGPSGPPPGSAGAYTGPSRDYESGMEPVGQLGSPPDTTLPELPPMTNLVALQGGDGASITFEPVDGALDYRVYQLPADGDVVVAADKSFYVKNGTYRCAGNREAPPVYADNEPMISGQALHTLVDKQMVGGYMRTLADATLGYVYVQPGDGRVPVYALGGSNPAADNSTCYFGRYGASRVKTYTTSEDERSELLKDVARDDGIVFWVPAEAADATTTVYWDEASPDKHRYYFPEGPEAEAHSKKAPAFQVLKDQVPGTQPLMRVNYSNQCGWAHDELVAGKERFNRVYHQGDKLPMFSLTWTGYTEPTTLVVEALDSGCPFQGHLSPASTPAFTSNNVAHQAWLTMDDVRAKAPNGQVFINGQFDSTSMPKPIARGFITVTPKPHPKMDFFQDFAPGSEDEAIKTVPCGLDNCYQTWRHQSETFDTMFINAENGPTKGTGLYAVGRVLGEWWVTYADIAADTNGKFRMTAKQKATIGSSDFLHVTMEVDAYSTARRYPQIIISTGDIPVQYALEKNHTLIVQPRASINSDLDFPVNYELQICNLRTWDVNNQCPVYDLYQQKEGNKVVHLGPADEFGEHASVDHRVLFDVFTSTERTYLFMDGQPYGCALLPSGVMSPGAVTVTWGDALYHSAVDHTYDFHTRHMLVEQRRHFDNLGFSSGVPAPKWDDSRFPCAAPISL